MKLDYLIVGAGLTGATVAERLHAAGKKVLVIDRRPHVAGNCFDELDEHGILVHLHGPHFFHTDSDTVWGYLSRFTRWLYRRYTHGVFVDGQVLDLPLNLQGLRVMFPSHVVSDLLTTGDYYTTLDRLEARSAREWAATVLDAKVYRPYSEKMWGRKLEDMDKSVLDRIPIRLTEATARYTAAFQGVPEEGYTRMVERMLEGVPLELGDSIHISGDPERIVYTGRIDEFFGYHLGALPYRTLDFEWEHHQDIDDYQEKAVVNYPRGHAFTRIVEHKKLTGQAAWGTTVSFETPREYSVYDLDVHYPVPTQAARELHGKYAEHAREAAPNVVFAGRLGSYRYLYMGEAVEAALNLADRLLKGDGR